MSDWTRHYLNARGLLDPYRDEIESSLAHTEEILKQYCASVELDIVLQAVPEGGVPELDHFGYAPRAGVIFLSFDSDNPNLKESLGQVLQRTIAHEVHHAMRWESVGYGKTLGEAAVTEGLAGRFVQQVFGSPPEQWEAAVPRSQMHAYIGAFHAAFDSDTYRHADWFFGAGELPKWLGYSIGRELVGDYLKANPAVPASQLADAPAAMFFPFVDGLQS